MGCRGVLFALEPQQLEALLGLPTHDSRVAYVCDNIEESLFGSKSAAETDKAWDAIHRCLEAGPPNYTASSPQGFAILGGEPLHSEDDYIIVLKTPEQVSLCAAALAEINPQTLRALYDLIDPDDYGMPLSDEDFEYTHEWFEVVRNFYQTAAGTGQPVIFTVDQ